MKDVPISLLYVPDPILDESPASWLMRVCQYHEVYPNKLFQVFGLPRMVDYDRGLGMPELETFTQGTKVSKEKIVCLSKKFEHVKANFLAEAFLLGCSEDKANYRYCPCCLAADHVPYWRLTWRMVHVYYCPLHQCELLSHCLQCGGVLEIARRRTSAFGEGDSAPICCFCTACGADLTHFSTKKLSPSTEFIKALDLQRAITAAVIHGHFFIYGISKPLPLRLLPRTIWLGGDKAETGDYQGSSELSSTIRSFLEGTVFGARVGMCNGDVREWMTQAMRVRFKKLLEEQFSDADHLL